MKEETAMEIGGWSDYQTMKRIYTHVSERDMRQQIGGYLDFFNKEENGRIDS